MTARLLITLRQQSDSQVELVVTCDGATAVYPLTLGQLKLIASQSVRAVCNWPNAFQLKRDTRDDVQRDYDEEREHGWSVP